MHYTPVGRSAIRISAILLLAAWASTPTFAQSPDRVLRQAAKALGGEKAVKAVRTRRASGTITRKRDGRSGRIEILTAQPGYYLQSTEIDGFETSEGYSGKSGWRRDSRDGLRTLTGRESLDFQFAAAYRNNLWFTAKRDKSRLAAGAAAQVGDRAANLVTLISNRNIRIKMYFDSGTGLLLREEIPEGETVRTYDYSDYRSVQQGRLEPFAVRLAVTGPAIEEEYDIRFDSILHNQPADAGEFAFPRISDEPLPDIPALLAAVDENEEKVERILDNYGYTEISTRREIGKDGKVKETSETEELSFYKGRRIRRLVAKNGQPLSPREQEREDRDVEKRVRKIEEELAEIEKGRQRGESDRPGRDDRRASVSALFRASKLINPRRERFRGREVIVFDFEPNPQYKGGKGIERFGGKTAGAMWIDPNDKQVVRVEARLIESFKIGGGLLASLKEGSTFVLEGARVNEEIWLPASVEANIAVRAFLLVGITINQSVRYMDYKRFNVEAEKEKLKSPDGAASKP
ncbi:MAG: hypothetical protein KF868_19215 [Acidobacteria bacterium]|nr:hypothetical protein [Acidobacteriota bacterium]